MKTTFFRFKSCCPHFQLTGVNKLLGADRYVVTDLLPAIYFMATFESADGTSLMKRFQVWKTVFLEYRTKTKKKFVKCAEFPFYAGLSVDFLFIVRYNHDMKLMETFPNLWKVTFTNLCIVLRFVQWLYLI